MRRFAHPSPARGLRVLLGVVGVAGVLAATRAGAQSTLPQWSSEEWERWQDSEEVPELGGTLFPRTNYSPEPAPEEPEEVPRSDGPVSLGVITDLPPGLVGQYFPEKLVDRILDPQSLLTQSRRDGILNFLDYHFREARSAIHIMILKDTQRVPSQVDLRKVHKQWFGDQLAVLVIYNFGNPGMSRLIFGSEAEGRVSEARRLRACFSSINEAVAVANLEDQLERFLTELSRQLYWIEGIFHGTSETPEAAADVPIMAPAPKKRGQLPVSREGVLFSVLAVVAALILAGAAIVSLQRRAARRAYFFPERRRFTRLGCPCGGGNRLVVSFGKAESAATPRDAGER